MDNGGHGGLGVTCESVVIYLIIVVEMYSSVAQYIIFSNNHI